MNAKQLELKTIKGIPRQSVHLEADGDYKEIYQANLTKDLYISLHQKQTEKRLLFDTPSYAAVCRKLAESWIHPEDRESFLESFDAENIIRRLQSGEMVIYTEARRMTWEGKYRWAASTTIRIENQNDSDFLVLGVITDIDDRKRKEQEAHRQKERLSALLKNTCRHLMEIDIQTGSYHLFMKKSYEDGKVARRGDYGELISYYAENYIVQKDRQRYLEEMSIGNLVQRLKQRDVEYVVDYTVQDGKKKMYVSRYNTMLQDEEGRQYILSYTKDNTGIVEEKRRSQKERERYLYAISALYEEIFEMDITNGTYRMMKESDALGCIPAEGELETGLGAYCENLIHPEDRRMFGIIFSSRGIRKLTRRGKERIYRELRRKRGDGYVWVALHVIPLPPKKPGELKVIMTYSDIDRVKSLEAERKQEDEQFGMAMRNSYDEVCEADLNTDRLTYLTFGKGGLGKITSRLGFTGEMEYLLEQEIHKEDRIKFSGLFMPEHLKEAFRAGETEVTGEFRRLGEKGIYHWYSLLVQKAAENDSGRLMLFFKNVDTVKQEEEKRNGILKAALDMTERASNAKSEFLSSMSHDIRTPMNAILGMTEIAERSLPDTARVADCLAKIKRSGEYLLSLINDVLDMSRIESGKIIIARDEFDFGEFVEGIRTIVAVQAKEKGIHFLITLKEGCANAYLGDSLRLNQVIINILSNALKFTGPGGSIELRIEEVEQVVDEALVRFVIKDTGIGMSKEFLNRLYNPFEQESPEISGNYGGTGLGLAITHNLVSMMDGFISVESEKGVGTTFTVEVPLGMSQAEGKTVSVRTEAQFHGERILLVEDNELNREIAKTILEYKALVVDEAADGQEAVDKFKESDIGYYGAVLMDLRMPVKDGLEAAKEIRGLPRPDARSIPVIAMSANAFREDIEKSKASGMNDHLTKPVNMEKLYRTLYHYMYGERE